MITKKHQWIFYLIATTILVTIGIQFYWNYKNYKENKQRVTNDIQLSLDNAVEEYFSSLAKSNFITIVKDDKPALKKDKIENIIDKFNGVSKTQKAKVAINTIKITSDDKLSKEKIDSMMNATKDFVTKFNNRDSIKTSKKIFTQFTENKSGYTVNSNGKKTAIQYFKGKKAADSLRFMSTVKPIFISFLDQSVAYKKLDSLIKNQLKVKGIKVQTSFHHLKKDTLFHKTNDSVLDKKALYVSSKSTFVRDGESFQLHYNNLSFETLKRSSFGIFLSFLLALAVIASLFYLLKIINQQKDLANIKNDLISNITHEFKTPIATVSTAIEAIENFNVLDDKEKTKKYLNLSSLQLKKLHQMVEKLLETATLDSEQLMLKKETIEITGIIERLINKHQLLSNKNIIFTTNVQPIFLNVDVFHFENCISNLIDNAVKYGGDTINININTILNAFEISVTDNGNGIEKNQQERIFDKFYRVQKGNTHNVKGFGIGLYYCKKIIEKHGGILQLISSKNNTTFKIELKNV